MKHIPLLDKHGMVKDYAIVDDADAERISAFPWHKDNRGYARRHNRGMKRSQSRRALMMHREILGLPPGRTPYVDHINGKKLDNRRSNLRECTPSQNCLNRRKPRGRALFKGVTKNTSGDKWQACIYVAGRRIHLGSFDTAEQAARAYDVAATKAHGDFATTNLAIGLLKAEGVT